VGVTGEGCKRSKEERNAEVINKRSQKSKMVENWTARSPEELLQEVDKIFYEL
jgi:hypothetical protein